MPDEPTPDAPTPDALTPEAPTPGEHAPVGPTRWETARKTTVRAVVAFAVAAVVAIIAVAVVPRWWAHRLGGYVDQSMTRGSFTGVVLGFLCSFVPILIVIRAIRTRARGTWLVLSLVGFVLFAFPNLATLWVAIGSSNSANAGRRTLDVDAPGVRGGTWVGIALGIVAVVALQYLLVTRRSARAAVRDAKTQAKAQAQDEDASAS